MSKKHAECIRNYHSDSVRNVANFGRKKGSTLLADNLKAIRSGGEGGGREARPI